MFDIYVDRANTVLFVDDCEIYPPVVRVVAQVFPNVQNFLSWCYICVRNIGYALCIPTELFEFFRFRVMPNNEVMTSVSAGTTYTNPRFAEETRVIVVVTISLTLLISLKVLTSSEGRNRCCFANS